MTKINIIPEKIPQQLWENDQYETIILYALGVYGPLKREEFINNRDKGISNRMNKNTFHKWAKRLKNNDYLSVSREREYSIYIITNLGVKLLIKRLKSNNLDLKTILNLERKSISIATTQNTQFLKDFEIENEDIMIEFLKLKNEITRDKLKLFSEDRFNRAILYITFNHPRYYNNFGSVNISIDDFIDKYGNSILSKDELKLFLHKLLMKKNISISFYKLNLVIKGIKLYFRSSEEYGGIFEITIQSLLRDHYYIQHVYNGKSPEIIINEICEEALTVLINKYHLFHKDLESPLYDTIKYYLLTLTKDLKKKVFIKSFDLLEIPTLILTSKLFDYERLDYLQKLTIFHLEEADNSLLPFEYRENIKFANKFINKAIDFDRDNPYNYSLKAQILHFMGKYEETLKAINKAITLEPDEARYYSELAFYLKWQNNYGEALDAINKAIEIEPEIAKYYSDLAFIFWSLDQHENVLDALNTAIKKDPQNIGYHISKAMCLAHNLGKHKLALNVLERLFQLNPQELELFEIYKTKVGILLSMKNREVALNLIRKTRQLFPNKDIYPNLH